MSHQVIFLWHLYSLENENSCNNIFLNNVSVNHKKMTRVYKKDYYQIHNKNYFVCYGIKNQVYCRLSFRRR